jgi:hypothetical protein
MSSNLLFINNFFQDKWIKYWEKRNIGRKEILREKNLGEIIA